MGSGNVKSYTFRKEVPSPGIPVALFDGGKTKVFKLNPKNESEVILKAIPHYFKEIKKKKKGLSELEMSEGDRKIIDDPKFAQKYKNKQKQITNIFQKYNYVGDVFPLNSTKKLIRPKEKDNQNIYWLTDSEVLKDSKSTEKDNPKTEEELEKELYKLAGYDYDGKFNVVKIEEELEIHEVNNEKEEILITEPPGKQVSEGESLLEKKTKKIPMFKDEKKKEKEIEDEDEGETDEEEGELIT